MLHCCGVSSRFTSVFLNDHVIAVVEELRMRFRDRDEYALCLQAGGTTNLHERQLYLADLRSLPVKRRHQSVLRIPKFMADFIHVLLGGGVGPFHKSPRMPCDKHIFCP